MKETAQGLAALGRGPDTELVHMTPGEVKSLQQLAMAGGGSLSINPATGLPEAGFLSSMLPMLIGAGLTAATGGAAAGAVAPWMIGAGVGGLEAARTGSLQKGLMAGFGAYGGAGLGAGLMGAGSEAVANQAVPALASGADAAAVNKYAADFMGAKNAALSGGFAGNLETMGKGIAGLGSSGGGAGLMSAMNGGKNLAMAGLAAASPMIATTTQQPEIQTDTNMGQRYSYSPGATRPTPMPDVPGYGNQGQNFGREQNYFNPRYSAISDQEAKGLYNFAAGGPVEDMSNANLTGSSTNYPLANHLSGAYSASNQQPMSNNVVTGAQDAAVDPYTGQQFAEGGPVGSFYYDQATGRYSGNPKTAESSGGLMEIVKRMNSAEGMGAAPQPYTYDPATQMYKKTEPSMPSAAVSPSAMNYLVSNDGGGFGSTSDPAAAAAADAAASADAGAANMAKGGIAALAQGVSNLGDYSDGGRLLRGPGDGVSDSIPAMIGKKQPARLADGEFVVPARIVSELGNGSTEAGARKLYAMMDRIQKSRGKTVGKGRVATNSRAEKHLPA